MIPLKLQLKNFVSYGPTIQSINFEPYQLICLSGKNGHGKSALLDALTWSLWGQARKISSAAKADEGLLKLGQNSMMVTLDFMCANNCYRVRREYTSGAKAYTNLHFGILDPASQLVKSLTEKTIKATQEKIETTLGLDFDSFVNSAFLRQGHSNEFSKKSPKDRKEILASILGLNQFELLKKAANERSRDCNQKKEYIAATRDHLWQEVRHTAHIKAELNQLQIALKNLNEEEQEYKQVLEEIKGHLQLLLPIRATYTALTIQQLSITTTLEQDIKNVIEEITAVRTFIKSQRAIHNYQNIEEERLHLNKELQQIQLEANQKLTIQENLVGAKESEKVYRQRLVDDYTNKIEQHTRLRQQLLINKESEEHVFENVTKQHIQHEQEIIKLKKEYGILQNSLQKSASIALSLQNHSIQYDKRKAYYHKFIAQGNWLKTQLATTNDKKKLTGTQNNPLCPLCEQYLSEAQKQNLTKTFTRQETFYSHQLVRLTAIIKNLKNLILEQHKTIEELKIHIKEQTIKEAQKHEITKTLDKEYAYLQSKSIEMQKSIELINLYSNQLIETEEKIHKEQQNFQQKEVTDRDYQAAIIHVNQLQEQLQKYTNRTERQTYINKRLQEILLLEKNNVAKKEVLVKEQQKYGISQSIKNIKALKAQLKTLSVEIDQHNCLLKNETDLLQKEQQLTILCNQLTVKKEQLIHQKGSLEQQFLSLEKKEQDYQNYQLQALELEENSSEYQAIAQALGKDGIQALLIEDAIPEIEYEANTLLSRLTDNQAQLSIESLRDLRSGGTKETLDIKISDTIGIRPYELFSGGEAFRIDFALRIAISKLLARRAGTALQTLIIDEGFGSQDEEGLAHIMEALYKIQDDFSKVIIVSHLPLFKEQLPVQFLVHKGPQGSTVQVVEQD
jgi:DNA repair protein SbcC/Rad50